MASATTGHQEAPISTKPSSYAAEPSSETFELSSTEPSAGFAAAKEQWNIPRINVWRTFAAFFSFIVMGANDAAYGPLIPNLEVYYTVNHTTVSLIFLSPFIGYILAALANDRIHTSLGRRGAALLGPLAHTLAYAVMASAPPFPVLVLAFILAGCGNGILDAAWNAWLGSMAHANELLGLLHAFYGAGAALSPLVASAMLDKAGLAWYDFYRYVMVGAACVEGAAGVAAFWREDAAAFRRHTAAEQGERSSLRAAVAQRVTWVVALFLLAYVGVEVSLGGWIVLFMTTVRGSGAFDAGMVSTGFWLGLTAGRVVLGFVTPRVGERLAVPAYLLAAMGMELLLWLVPSFVASALAVGLLGFFLGPLFPAAVVATTKILPARLHVSAIGFAAAFGGSGACVLPFAVGAIAQSAGVAVLQPFVLGILGVASALWIFGMPPPQTGSRSRTTLSAMRDRVASLWARLVK